MTDVVAALMAVLKTDSPVAALAATRVFGGELPRGEVASMPRAAVVLKTAGGGLMGQAYQQYGDRRIDVTCYAATPYDAETLHVAVHAALKQLRRVISEGVLLHWARVSSDGTGLRDPDTDWPLVMSSYQVLASEIEA